MKQIRETLKKGEATKKEILTFIKTRKRTNPWDKKNLDSLAKWVRNYVSGRKDPKRKQKNVAKKKAQTIDTFAWLKDGF
jgi:hypothetical protein